MHHASAILGGDKVARHHNESMRVISKVGKQRRIPAANQRVPRDRFHHLETFEFARIRLEPSRGKNIRHVVATYLYVVHVRSDRKCEIARQRPWRCGPRQEVLVVSQVERDRQCRVLHLLVGVVHPRFRVGKRRLKCPRKWQNAKALIHESLVPQRLECPHDAFHIRQIKRLVIVREVHPPCLSIDVALPIGGVLQYRGAAVIVELGDPKVGDGLTSRDAELSLGFCLGGQTMAVPAESALDVLAAHRLIARYRILDEAGQKVAVVRQAVRKRWTVIKNELVRAFFPYGTGSNRCLERAIVAPEVEDASLKSGDVWLRFNFGIRHDETVYEAP